jgi:hypothetical protein
MDLIKKYRKGIIITSLVVISIIILILTLQVFLSNIISNKVENALSKRKDNHYIISVDKTKVNLFTMTLIFKDISISPDSILMTRLKSKNEYQRKVVKIDIPALRVRNIGIISLLTNRRINIGGFILNDARISLYTDGRSDKKSTELPEKPQNGIFNIDSIVLPGIGGGDINKLMINNFEFTIIDILKNDTTFSAKNLGLSFDNLVLTKNESDSNSFSLKIKDVDFEMANDRFYLPGGKYVMSFKDVNYNMINEKMVFTDLIIQPMYNQKRMVELSKYQYEIYDVEISKAEVNSINLHQVIRESKIYLSNVVIDGMKLNIFKDKRRPFDESKRPKLPQQLLKELKKDLYIDSLTIINSSMVYSEQHELMKDPMKVTLSDFNVKVKKITSVVDSIINGIEMSVQLNAKIQNTIKMNIELFFPMKSISDTFMFRGYLGKGDMKIFNPVVLPAIGVKFESGNLDKIRFSASANPDYAIGEMTMLYHDLQGSVQRQDMIETNKFLSWVANSVIISNNPAKDKKEPRVAPMFFERVEYKGLGNYLWKTIQTGITATIVPTMSKKVQSKIDQTLGTDPKEIRKRDRKEKRKKRKSK